LKIFIIGKGPGWEHAPTEGETWGVNDLILRRPVKLAFEMHDIDGLTATKVPYLRKKETVKKVNELGIPVITLTKHKLLPTAIPFPIDEMPFKYFTNSIAYMIAYAIYKRATEIELYGVPLLYLEEYTKQQPCIEFWLGYAMAKGIKVVVHGPTNIFSAEPYKGLYGYDWDNVNGQKTQEKINE